MRAKLGKSEARMNSASPFSKDFVGTVAQSLEPGQPRKVKLSQPPKNARAVLQEDVPMKSAKLRRGSI